MAHRPLARFAVPLLALLLGLAGLPSRAQDGAVLDEDPPSRAARLALIRGEVSLQPAGEDEWAPALLNRPLTTGDKLWTEDDARAEIQVGQVAIRLAEHTGFSFLTLDDETLQMRVTAGTLIVDVRELPGNEQIEIGTPNVSLSLLRPGSYRVEVDEQGDLTTVRIGDGEAEAYGPSLDTLIRSRQVVTFRGTEELVADWSSPGPPDEFDRWSLERERRLEQRASSRYVSPDVTGYEDLDDHGSWSSEPEYGYVWTPRYVAVDWSPYRYGRWVWISPWGWTWIDDAPWGYAPFHYGRWVHVRHRWCWVPGPRHLRPVYAPALVGWIGSPGLSVGWFPLGPHEVYVPWRWHSRRYLDRVNHSNTVIANRRHIIDVVENRIENRYRNRQVPGGVTVMPRAAFTAAGRVADHRIRRPDREFDRSVASAVIPRIDPARESRLGGPVRTPVARPSRSVAERPVVVRREPPPVSARFARRAEESVRDASGLPRADRPIAQRRPEVSQPAPQASPVPPPSRTRDSDPRAERRGHVIDRAAGQAAPQDLRRDDLPRATDDPRDDRPRRDDRPPRESWRSDRPAVLPEGPSRSPVTDPRAIADRVRADRERQVREYRERQDRPLESPRDEQARMESPRLRERVERRRDEAPRMEQPRMERRVEQPRVEQPRVERPRVEQPRVEQPRAAPQESRSHPRSGNGDGGRRHRD